ncbi:MAG: hypothetical protein JJE39_07130 [Vicinamibacteria bacterium]|nr:hypothetical protein [Vicinamibacteria bacterium]
MTGGSREGRAGPAPFLAGAFFLVLTFLWCGPILTDPAHVAADVGDPLHMAWVMAWVGHQLPLDPLGLFDSNNFYPYPKSLAFGDHLLPEAVLGLPINLATGNAILALNAVTAFGLFSSALAAYFLVSSLLDSRGAGLVAGTVLAFNSFMQSELLRVNVLQLQGWCLALFFLWRFTERPSWRHSAGLSLALALQGLTGTYYAVYSAILAPGFVVAAYGARKRVPALAEVWRLSLPALVTGTLGLLFLSPYREVLAQSLAQKPIPNGADIASFFLPGSAFWLWGGLFSSAPHGESSHFLGYLPLLLAAVGIGAGIFGKTPSPPATRFLIFSAVVLISVGLLISFGAYPRLMGESLGRSPYLLVLRFVPTLRGMATVERAGALVQVGVALLAGVGAERLFRKRPGLALVFALSAFSAAEQWTRPGTGFRIPAGDELPEVYRWLKGDRGPLAELPLFPDRLIRFRALYPYFSTYNWRPVPIGRASFYPPAHDYLANLLQSFPDEVSIEALRATGIRDIVVHPRMKQTRRGAFLKALEGPDLELIRSFKEEVSEAAKNLDLGDERVYRLRPGPRLPSVCQPTLEVDGRAMKIASSATQGIERIRDGDRATAWSTVNSQEVGDFIEFRWPEAQSLSAIRMFLGSRTLDFPTALRVDLATESGEWQEVSAWRPVESAIETLGQLLRSDPNASITIRMPLTKTRGVRLRLGEDENRPGWNPWSIAEIHFLSQCSDVGQP